MIWYSEEDTVYLVEILELPGCKVDEEIIEEVIQTAQIAIQMWIEAARKLGRPVPKPARTRKAVTALFTTTALA